MKRFLPPLLLIFFFSAFSASAANVRITNVSDFALGTWGMASPPISASIDLCIYNSLNILDVTYSVTINSADGFVLKNGSQTIPFTLYWADTLSSNSTQVFNNVKLPNQYNANVLSSTCFLTGPNARLNLRISYAAMAAALAGTYNGSINIIISPN